ncbi:MAG: hypothetical protein HYT72_03200 [Candidatus Aenigmarchaeota archaeon]|nr:hypothetical protein [Candidatus Aenigmarchaeota archaeon]
MSEPGIGFHVRRILIRPDGSREDEGLIFPQGYDQMKTGSLLPYPTMDEARLAKQQILAEGLPSGRTLVIYSVNEVE